MPLLSSLPGVPPLLQLIPITVPSLLMADSISSAQFESRWGVYKNGRPVVIFDTFVSIDYRQGWTISDFPLEQGAFESYDKVSLPFDARVKFAAGETLEKRRNLLRSVEAISKTLELYEVVTPEKVYTSVNVQHYDYHRTATNGVGLLTVEMWLLEVRIGATGTSQVTGGANATNAQATDQSAAIPLPQSRPALTATADPSGASPFNAGVLQGQPVTFSERFGDFQ